MKRQRFRLGNVLRYYEVQKQRAEFELQKESKILRDTDAEIERLQAEIAAISSMLHDVAWSETTPQPWASPQQGLTSAGWMASYRHAEILGIRLTAAHTRRIREAENVARCIAVLTRWSVAEETLCSLRAQVDSFNREQLDKAHQELLDDSVLRQWVEKDL
jgi:hypothetical protein